ncbi:RAD51-associated protein 2 [Thomomys bottae]
MSLPQPSPQPAEQAGLPSSPPPPEDPHSPPSPSKRSRLGEAGSVSPAGWQPPWVPEVEELRRGWPSGFQKPLTRQKAGVEGASGPGVGARARGVPVWNVACQNSKFPFSPPRSGSGWSGAGRPGEPGPRAGEVFCVVRRAGSPVEAREARSPPGLMQSPGFDLTGQEEAEENGPLDGEEKSGSSSSVLRLPKAPNRPGPEGARRSCGQEKSAISVPEFPEGLNGSRSPVYSEEIAKTDSDTSGADVREFTNIPRCQNRPELREGEDRVHAQCNVLHDAQGIQPSLSNPSASERRNEASVQCHVRDTEKNFTLTLGNGNWPGAQRSQDSFLPARLEKSRDWNRNIRRGLERNRENGWIMENCKTNRENMENTGENLNFSRLLELDFLQSDYPCTKVTDIHTQQSKSLMIEYVGNQKTLIKIVPLSDEGENDIMLQFRYIMENDFILGNILHRIITEMFYFPTNVSENKKDNIVNWYEILKCKRQISVEDKLVITRNMLVDIKNDILHKYLQAGVSDDLIDILKTNITFLLNTFDFLSRIKNNSELQLIVHLNSQKNSTVGNHTIRILTFSKPLQSNLKPILKKRKLSETKKVLEGLKKKNIDSINMTTKNKRLPIFEAYNNFPLSMYSDKAEEIILTNEFNFKIASCPEEQTNVESWTCHNCTERKQEHDIVSHFNFKYVFEDFFNIKQQIIPISQSEQINTQTVPHMFNTENLLSEIEKKKYLILPEEVKVTVPNLTNTLQVYRDINLEKEEEDIYFSVRDIHSMKTDSLMSEKVNVEETKFVNQSNRDDKNESESIFPESEQANSKPFHLKTDSALCVNHQIETDSSEENNECFQSSVAKCLSTEAPTIAKDFVMKSKFDLVLEELHLFHEISKENEIPSTVETNNHQGNYLGASNDVEEARMESGKDLKLFAANKICTTSLPCDKMANPTMLKRHQSLFKWKTAPRIREQGVLCYPRRSEKKVLYSNSEEACKNPLPNRHTCLPDECKEEKINDLLKGDSPFSHGIARIQPLKTCSRPIRIGLSRKARLVQLHPYLK